MLKLDNTLGRAFTSFFAVVALVFLTATPVSAQSSDEDMESQIEELEALIAELQAQLSGQGTVVVDANTCPVDPNLIVAVPLKIGFSGKDAQQVQILMNHFAAELGLDTRVAVSGAGSPGMETPYYGPATAAAVSRFQVAYRAQILTPNGLTVPTGIFGPSTSAQVQLLCSELAAGDDDDSDVEEPSDDEDEDEDEDMSDEEATLEGFDVSDDNNDVEEGEEDAEVLTFEFDVEDGDVEVQRVDVRFEAASTSPEDEPWEYFDEVSLWNGDEEVARVDASDEDEWEELEDSHISPTGTEAYEIRFTGLEERFDEGETAEFTVAVSVASNLDSDDLDQSFDVWVPEDGVRAIDGAGINQYTGIDGDDPSSSEYATVEFDEEGEGEELSVSESSDNPDESVVRVEEEATSDAYTLLAFTLEAEDNDIEVTELPITVDIGVTETLDEVIHDAWLEIDGEEYSDYDESPTSGTSTSAGFTLTFDLDDFVVEEGEEVEVLFVVEFNEQEGNYSNGQTIDASVDVDDIEAEGAEDVDAEGSAVGEEHTLLAEGIFAEATATSADDEDTSTSAGGEVGEYSITFEITAFEDDFYLPMTAERDSVSGSSTSGFVYDVTSGGSVVTTGTTTDSITDRSNADESGSYWIVREGTTESFQLQVSYTPASDGFYAVQLDTIHYNTSASTSSLSSYDPQPDEDFETDEVNLDA